MSRSWLTPVVVLALIVFAVSSGEARAGEGVRPSGTTIGVRVDDAGRIEAPRVVELVVRLDDGDLDAQVVLGPEPEAAGDAVCSAGDLRPGPGAGEVVCAIPTASLTLDATYTWWLVVRRPDEADGRASGPYTFTLRRAPAPAPRPSTRTYLSAATLPSRAAFADASVKHTTLTSMLYELMKRLGRPKRLAVACWHERDFDAVARSARIGLARAGDVFLDGFWLGLQPRWLHLAPTPCRQIQALLDTGAPNGYRAAALAAAIHETLHAHGYESEAMTNCVAVQLVPLAAELLRLPPARAAYLGRLAVRKTRATAPPGYWNAWRCRNGGPWDLQRAVANLA